MRASHRFVLITSLSTFLLHGCTGTQVQQHAFNEYLEAGITVAANTGGPKYDGDLFRYERVMTLQQDPGQPESFIYQTRSFLRTVKGFFLGEDGIFRNLEQIKTREDALKRALRLEQDTLSYYQAMRDLMGENSTVDAMIQAERNHIATLLSRIG